MIFFRSTLKEVDDEGVNLFKNKQIFGILAGGAETQNYDKKTKMDAFLKARNLIKWFEGVNFDPVSPPQTSALSCVPAETDGPDAGNTIGTAAAALPRARFRQGVVAPMRKAQAQIRPRLTTKFAGSRLVASLR